MTEIGINRYCVWTVRDFSFPNTIGIPNRFQLLRVTFTKLSPGFCHTDEARARMLRARASHETRVSDSLHCLNLDR